jgi:TMEM175 potassium channel family protein
MSTNRLEAFSDGVLAVAITLLVLELRVPPTGGHSTLAHALLAQWPQYAAYVTSFVTIGIIWINHHAMIGRLREADRTILALNLLLLLTIGVLPFATDLMATYLKQSRGQHLAAGVYSGAFLLMSIAFVSLNGHILLSKSRLLGLDLTLEQRRKILLRGGTGVVPYVMATALAPVSPYITLGICGAVAGYYALPVGSGG